MTNNSIPANGTVPVGTHSNSNTTTRLEYHETSRLRTMAYTYERSAEDVNGLAARGAATARARAHYLSRREARLAYRASLRGE